MLNINEIISAAKSRLGTLSNPLRIAAIAAIVLVAATVLYLIFNTLWLYFASRSYVNEIAFASGWNRHVANAIAWLVFAAMAYFGAIVFSLSKQKRRIGIAGILGLLIAQSLLLWHGTRDQIIARDGKAIKCYVITRTGVIYSEILDGRPIIEPTTGRTCNPVTVQMAERLRQYETGKRPRSVPTVSPEFFDLATGEPIIWFHKTKDAIEIFDLFGFHPDTGAELLPVTREIVGAWRTQQEERAKRPPDPIILDQYNPFDPLTGQPRVWYRRNGAGFEFFNRPGFDGRTGEQLTVITQDIVSEWRRTEDEKKEKASKPAPRPPLPITDISKHELFDHKTGEPRTWYWRGDNGEYEFFDGPGYHTRTGTALNVLTKDALAAWQRQMAEHARTIREEQAQRDAEARKRKEQEERDRQAREEQEKKDRTAREEQRQRDGELARQCDQLAANPNDPRRVGDGVAFDTMRLQADAAIAACERAVQQAPNELRFQYQLGRALQVKDRRRAAEIHQRLVRSGYPAAFDNLGWIYLQDQKNSSEAVNLFLRGEQAGDPDAMMSLVEMIDRGHFTPPNLAAKKIQLLMRARQLGHAGAARAIEAEEQKERQHGAQLEQQQRAIETMMTIINGLPRR